MSYTPKNNFNLQLKRTGAGEVGFRKKLWKTVVNTCEDPEYYFRLVPSQNSFYKNDSQEISVVGGVGDFNWSMVGSGFSLADATTSGRTNTVSTDGTVGSGDSAILTVVDSCGNSISSNLKVCYNVDPPITIYDEWSSCFTDSLWGQLVGVEQIGDLLYLIIDNGSYTHLASWDGESSSFTLIIEGYDYSQCFGSCLIGNTIYIESTEAGVGLNMLSWTVGDETWTVHNGLGRRGLLNHEGDLWSFKRVTNPGALYKLETGVWVEKAAYLDKEVDYSIHYDCMLSFGGEIYTGGFSDYGGGDTKDELRIYVPGDPEGDPSIPHDMKVCLFEPGDSTVKFKTSIEVDGFIYAVASNGRLYRGTPLIGDTIIDQISDIPTYVGLGHTFQLIKHGSYIFGIDSKLNLFRWSSSIGAWATSAEGPGGDYSRGSIMFAFKGRLYAARADIYGQFCIVRWGV